MQHLPQAADLDSLFRPRSVAILGASEDATRISGRPVRYLIEGGFKGAFTRLTRTARLCRASKPTNRLRICPKCQMWP